MHQGHSQSTTSKERAKYSAIWKVPAYHNSSPGENFVLPFMKISGAQPNETVIDVGAGAGAASRALASQGLAVTAFDLTNEAWTHTDILLIEGSIWHGLPRSTGTNGNHMYDGKFDYVYCCDMMEHLPTEFTALAINNLLSVSRKGVFLSICFIPDVMGQLIRLPLHLTVKPFAWWLSLLRELGSVREARDILGDGLFYVTRDL